jgi:hypothetical protein
VSFTSTQAMTVAKAWAAFGHGLAVHGKTEEEAVELYREAVERHREMDVRAVEGSEEVSIH